MARQVFFFSLAILLNSLKGASQLHFKATSDSSSKKVSLKVLPQNFYIQHLGFFCKKEVQIQKLTALPVFIRLGSKEYVDYLEKKPGSSTGRKE